MKIYSKNIIKILFVVTCFFNSIFFSDSFGINNDNDVHAVNNISAFDEYTSCPVSWEAMIYATDASNKSDSVTIGMSPGATLGIDTCLGEYLIPPPPPAGIFDFRIILPPTYNLNATKTDFRNDIYTSVTYWLNYQASVSGPVTFTWDPAAFPITGTFYLTEEILGTSINMKTQNNFVLTNQGIRHIKIEYQQNSIYNFDVLSGWNLISVPLLSGDMSVSSIYDNDVSSAFSYNNGYTNVSALTNGTGYWINFPLTKSYEMYGLINNNKKINVAAEWNMVGPFDGNIPVSEIVSVPPGLLISNFFGYQNGYFNADTLKPGNGYWVKSGGAGYFMKDTNVIFRPFISGNLYSGLNDYIRIEFSDKNGNVSNLYLINKNESSADFDLPPVPPAGIFDVRFTSDKFAESLGKILTIKTNSAERPLYIRSFNLKNSKLKLKDNIDGTILDVLLSENETVVINNSLDNFVISEETALPRSFELSQNYPNPFNPSTVIAYQIPDAGNVKLTVYNVLGKEVSVLVNDFRQAGVYEINFNANDLSSGLYYYKLQSGSFTKFKSMLLLK